MILRAAYRMLEDIVGPENISEDPAILDSYAFQHLAELQEAGSKWLPRPAVVVLPGSVEEVQGVVKVCNRFHLRFKAHSTGWGLWSAAGGGDFVLLDLRRMNRIVLIDEDNMYAVVEPYVTFAQLQAEAMKRGLTCHVIGAGANASVLASCTSMWGYGWTGVKMGFNGRNVLAVEWVLPTGEILRLGSLERGEWFYGDGPGPSLRGVMRGWLGAMGGLGVFTKCAVKLYEWPGPRILEVSGVTPTYRARVPESFKVFILTFPSWKELSEAVYMIGEAEIGFAMCVGANSVLELATPPSSPPPWSNLKVDESTPSLVLLLGGSKRQLEYEEKVLSEILARTKGNVHPASENQHVREHVFLAMIKGCYNARSVFKAGGLHTSFGSPESWDAVVRGAMVGGEVKRGFLEAGLLGEGGVTGGIYEHGCIGHLEHRFSYDPMDPDSREAAREYTQACVDASIDELLGFGLELLAEGSWIHDTYGPFMCNYHKWMRRVKAALDPENLSDSSYYINPEK